MKTAAIGIIFNHDQTKVLLVKRRDVPLWVLPGGGVESWESPEIAVIREVYEETGLRVTIKRKVGEYYPLNRLAAYTEVFECITIKGLPSTGSETKEIHFFSTHQLPKRFFEIHELWLKDALENKPYVLKLPIAQVTYKKLIKFFFKHPILGIRLIFSRFGFPINS